ncbi:hypothetical protein [Thermus amyloliquefaciens]|uniref:hypothetical protein n=1 Tax=Thermus amyloliquefaciens TaxID=1449080 RepID=UPI00163AC7BD|nr:hypothetical protein [Thermus amyloliquefaciens]
MDKTEAQDWRASSLGGGWLTTGDVARRVGISPGTARYYAGLLLDRGYPLRKEQKEKGEEYLWPPEAAELLRLAYGVARSVSPRLSVEEALSLLETAGRLARGLKEGAPTIPEVVRDLKGLGEVLEAFRGEAKRYERLSGEMSATLGGFLRRLEGEMQGFVADTRREVSEALSRVVNPLVPATTLAVLSSLFAVGFLVLSSVHSAGWVSALPYLGAALLGGAVVWWLRG